MEKYKKLVVSSSVQVENGYVVDNYFDNTINIGYSVVRTHLDGEHPEMLNKSSNRTYYLIKGSAEFNISGEKVKIKSGEMLTIMKNTRYSFKGKFDAILIDCPRFNPKDDVIFR